MCNCNRRSNGSCNVYDNYEGYDNEWRNGCRNDYEAVNYDNNALREAECIAREAFQRQCRENRCARQFICCMRKANCNW